MKIKCMLDTIEYKNKPQGYEIAKITNRLANGAIEINVEDLSKKLTNGCTFKPSELSGKREENWIQQQLFALDFDDGITIKQALNKCTELNILPVFGYTSFSHTKEKNRFRLVFCTDNVITDYKIAKQLQLTLMSIFVECDDKCKNLSRLYFGGRELIYKGYDNRIDYKNIIQKYHINIDKDISKASNIKGGEKKPQDNNRMYNTHILSCGEKPPKTQTIDNYYNIKAIRERNAEYLKNKINNPHIILENNQAFYEYIFKEINLGEFLEYQYPKSIKCLFHEDNNPSASIFQNEEGYWIYHCFSCGVSYNLLNIIEVLGNFKSRPKAYKFIREIFNIEISETEWQKEQKEILRENHKMLLSGELERQCPTAYKNIKRNIKYLDQLFLIAEDNVYSEKFTDNDDNVVFYASTKYICDKLGLSKNSAIEVSKKNVLFQYHNLLNKIADEEIPVDMLKRSQAIGANNENKHMKHVNYFSIPSYTTILFNDIENQGKQWNENNYKMKGLSREMFYRTEGEEVANKLYPQYKEVYDKKNKEVVKRTTTNISNVRTDLIVTIIFDTLKVKSYVTDKEIIDELNSNEEVKTSKTEGERQLKKSIQEILDSYNLKRIRCNKKIKEQYGVAENGYPFIIVK
ncbi:hypothetical protein [Clostridium sp. DMHC 10]|uniref:hypothetical protein n=1 Tax=Clostridium sp. DMHC 10 TaxID=747377 RepID=UPI000A0450C0|nr:hypothetical protein [Clostridium sp. DMHC 10]